MNFEIRVSARPVDLLRSGDPRFVWSCVPKDDSGDPGRTGYGHDAKDARNRAVDWANNYATVQTHTGTFTYDTETREFTRNDS